jgi:hypothetical protein
MNMADAQLRGYTVANAAVYLRQAGDGAGQRAFDKLPAATREACNAAKPAEWYPVTHISDICDAVASLGNGNDDVAKEELIKCGRHIAREATNTFLRLLMRMLSPERFAAKLPDFWKRDCTGGRLVVDVSDRTLTVRVHDIPQWHHVLITSIGYAGFALEAMGKVIENTAVRDWSIAKPYVDGASFELTWKA